VPLSKIQGDILRFLASHRDPESYVAGSTPLNLNALHFSGDIDVFHDREERAAQAKKRTWHFYFLEEPLFFANGWLHPDLPARGAVALTRCGRGPGCFSVSLKGILAPPTDFTRPRAKGENGRSNLARPSRSQ
jgi:hypothetical protein